MTSENEHIGKEERLDEESEKLFKSIKPPFSKTKDELWLELNSKLAVAEKSKPVVRELNWFMYAAAASVVLVFGLGGLFAKLHEVQVVAMNGEHLTELLPDGSEVVLNAGSELSYHPYWWWANRDVAFEGEGFFSVQKGSNFTVVSNNGTTEVLGTSFNVNSRWESYEVLCLTGSVRVSNDGGKVELAPNEIAISTSIGGLEKSLIGNKEEVVGWLQNKFFFAASPLNEVIREVELQYDVQVQFSDENSAQLIYSGYFNRTETVDEVLDIIGQAMGLKFVKEGASTYTVSQAN
ncbi:MAG: transmembrane sensor [Bacteroidia bacterium]|jgi:transmembrane sensor